MTPSAVTVIFYILIILYTTSFVYSQSSCDPNTPKTTALRLKKDILCGYDKQVRPVGFHKNQTTVTLMVVPRYMDFQESSSILKVTSWIGMSWIDKHLKWDPAQYDHITTLLLDSQTVWFPDMAMFNLVNIELALDSVKAPCTVDKDGLVHTIVQSALVFHCMSDWYNWPYDVHECAMTVDSISYLGSRLDIDDSKKRALYMNFFIRHREWDLLNSSVSRRVLYYFGQENYTDSIYDVALDFKFSFKRHASVYIASYVVPGIVMMVMSLCVPWMDTSRSERIIILCTLAILQSLYLQYIAYKLPSNGDTTPRVVCFYRDSLFITGVLFIVTVITHQMFSWTWKPAFLQSFFNFVAASRPAKFIMFIDNDPKNAAELSEVGEEAVTLVTRDQGGPHHWQIISLLINRLAFLCVLISNLFISLYLFPQLF